MNATRGIGPEKMTFMAEGKPGFPDAYDERLLNNERRKNELLTEENKRLRDEIGKLNCKHQDMRGLMLLAVKEVFDK